MELNKFDVLQTFYVDSTAVAGSSEIFLTSIEVFFKSKPTSSAISGPGVVLSICDVENDLPVLTKVYDASLVRVENNAIYAFSDASVSTTFTFKHPLVLKTNKFYGFVLQYDSPGFELWCNKQGDKILGTNIPSPGINSTKDGKFFNGAVNTTILQPLTNIDLKYKVNIAKFTANTLSVELVNKDYEFLSIANVHGSFIGGEYVYKLGANAAGTLSVTLGNTNIIGTGTNFSSLHSGDKLVINGTVLTVASVQSNTSLFTTTIPLFTNSSANYIVDVVGKVYNFNKVAKTLTLYESTANTAHVLGPSDSIIGSYSGANCVITSVNDFPVDRVMPMIGITSPALATYSGTYNFSYSNGSNIIVDGAKETQISINALNDVSSYGALVCSRSNEVLNNFLYDNVARKSAVTKLSFQLNATTNNLYSAPSINEDEIDFFIQQTDVTSTSEELRNGISYDTEVDKNGIGASKHISKKITFANNRFAEDIRVFMNAYRPPNTNIKVYCKVHNSTDPEAFDDKQWTPLEIIDNKDRWSSTENINDYIEYTIGLPRYPETANTIPGTFKIESANSILVGSGLTVNTYVQPGDVVRLYNPLEANTNYFVTGVLASNTSSITINTPTSNSSVLGTGFKLDKVKYKNVAYSDPQNDNVCTYFTSELAQINKYDTMQIKIVFTATNTYYIPRVTSISVLGVSA